MSQTTSNPAARVQLIKSLPMSPGCCALCGTSDHPEGFADPQLYYEFYGNVYLCGTCIGDFARLFGWEHPQKVYLLLLELKDVKEELERAYDDLANLGDIKDAIDNYNSGVHVDSVNRREPLSVADNSPAESEYAKILTTSGVQPDFIGVDPPRDAKPELDVTELVSVEGADGVSSLTSDDFLTGLGIEL